MSTLCCTSCSGHTSHPAWHWPHCALSGVCASVQHTHDSAPRLCPSLSTLVSPDTPTKSEKSAQPISQRPRSVGSPIISLHKQSLNGISSSSSQYWQSCLEICMSIWGPSASSSSCLSVARDKYKEHTPSCGATGLRLFQADPHTITTRTGRSTICCILTHTHTHTRTHAHTHTRTNTPPPRAPTRVRPYMCPMSAQPKPQVFFASRSSALLGRAASSSTGWPTAVCASLRPCSCCVNHDVMTSQQLGPCLVSSKLTPCRKTT